MSQTRGAQHAKGGGRAHIGEAEVGLHVAGLHTQRLPAKVARCLELATLCVSRRPQGQADVVSASKRVARLLVFRQQSGRLLRRPRARALCATAARLR